MRAGFYFQIRNMTHDTGLTDGHGTHIEDGKDILAHAQRGLIPRIDIPIMAAQPALRSQVDTQTHKQSKQPG
jgi:hypothetical protein